MAFAVGLVCGLVLGCCGGLLLMGLLVAGKDTWVETGPRR